MKMIGSTTFLPRPSKDLFQPPLSGLRPMRLSTDNGNAILWRSPFAMFVYAYGNRDMYGVPNDACFAKSQCVENPLIPRKYQEARTS